MEDNMFSITSKNIKNINDFNQIIKKVFNECYLFNDGIIIDSFDNKKIDKGEHFAFIQLNPFDVFIEGIIQLIPPIIFKTIKDNKKNINILKIKNSEIFISTEKDDYNIGSKVNQPTELIIKNQLYKILMKNCEEKNYLLDNKIIDSLCENEIHIFDKDGYKVRITKELIPSIKKGMTVSLTPLNRDEPTLFDIIIRVNRDYVTSFHRYTCIKY